MVVDQSPGDPDNDSQTAQPAVVAIDADIAGTTAPIATNTAAAVSPRPAAVVHFTLMTVRGRAATGTSARG
jgi:hypothetical protein